MLAKGSQIHDRQFLALPCGNDSVFFELTFLGLTFFGLTFFDLTFFDLTPDLRPGLNCVVAPAAATSLYNLPR